jgi:regulation of enolase protein 1 (concanavalin A-like superfamily)
MARVKQKILVAAISILMILGMLYAAIPVEAKTSVIHVYPGDLIQNAINTASSGDKIIVHAGTYSDELLVVDKALTLLGDGALLEYSQDVGTGFKLPIQVTTGGVRISGFTIRVTTPTIITAIDFSGTTVGCLIDNNIIESKNWGVSGYGSSNVEVRNNEIASTIPVYCTNALNIVVHNNILNALTLVTPNDRLFPAGIRLEGSSSNGKIKNNKITSDRYGILIGSEPPTGANMTVTNNEIYCNQNGIKVNSANAVVKNNVIFTSLGTSAVGIGTSGANPVITGNFVNSTDTGISVLNGDNAVIRNNEVNATVMGINVAGPNAIVKNNNVYASLSTASIGIRISGSDPVVTGNFVNSTGSGITILNGDNAIIQNNDVNATTFGIILGALDSSYETKNPVVSDNVVYNSNFGIVPIRVLNGKINNNAVNSSIFGIGLSGVNNEIKSNTVTGNFANGINIRFQQPPGSPILESTGNVIADNTIVGGNKIGDIGIYLYPSTFHNLVKSNVISGVETTIKDEGTGNIVIQDFELNQKYSDEFNSKNLAKKWLFINPDDDNPSGQYYSLTENPGFLTLTTTGTTDIFGQDTAPRIMETAPTGDFQIVLHLKANINPAIQFEHAGILIYTDIGNWVRLLRDSNGNSVFLQSATGAWIAVPFTGNDVTLRLTKNGNAYKGEYSTNGVDYMLVGTTIPSPFTPNLIGFNVADTVQGDIFSAAFDYFRVYTPKTNCKLKTKTIFKDDFRKTDLKDWITVFGTWTVQNGKLTQNDPSAGSAPWWTGRPAIVADCTVSDNFRIETKFSQTQGSIAVLFRYQQDIGNTEYVIFHGGSNIIIGATVGGYEISRWFDFGYSRGTEHKAVIEVQGSIVVVYVDGTLAAFDDVSDRGFVYSSGRIGFDTWYTAATFDDLVVSTTR